MLLVGALVASCGGRESEASKAVARRAEQARAVAQRAGLPPAVQEFIALYATAPAARVSVTYRTRSAPGTTIRVDQDPPRRRVDVTSPGEPRLRSLVQTSTGTYSCAREGRAWTCRRDAASAPALTGLGALDPGDVNRTVASLTASRTNFDYRVERRRIAVTQARCLVTTPRAAADVTTGPSSLCISGHGVVLLVERPGESLRALRYSHDVDDDRFRLPARPQA